MAGFSNLMELTNYKSLSRLRRLIEYYGLNSICYLEYQSLYSNTDKYTYCAVTSLVFSAFVNHINITIIICHQNYGRGLKKITGVLYLNTLLVYIGKAYYGMEVLQRV